MSIKQVPVPGDYYINLTGQLIKVKLLLYKELEPATVLIEYLDGKRMKLDIEEWNWLDLPVYPDWLESEKDEVDLYEY